MKCIFIDCCHKFNLRLIKIIRVLILVSLISNEFLEEKEREAINLHTALIPHSRLSYKLYIDQT